MAKEVKALIKKADPISEPDSKYNARNWFVTCEINGTETHGWYWGSKDMAAEVGKEIDMLVDKSEAKGKAKFKISFPKGKGFGGKAYNPTPEQQMRMAAANCATNWYLGMIQAGNPVKWEGWKEKAEEIEQWIKG